MENQICKIHNEPALFYEKDSQQSLLLMCRFCIQEKFKVQNIDDINNEQKQLLQQLELKYDQSIKQLQDFDGRLEQYVQLIQQKLKKFKQQVEQNITYLIEKKNQIKSKSKDFTTLQLNQINEEENIIISLFSQVKQQLNDQLKELEISNKLNQLYKVLNNLQINIINKENEQVEIQKMPVLDKKFNYQFMQKLSYFEHCYVVAFNKDATIMIAGCKQLIKVLKFKEGQFSEVEQLSQHKSMVECLQFMKKSNQFISASSDSTIIIWEEDQNYKWQCNQILQSHKSIINCITMNQNEDILISGSHDKSIKLWQKQNNIWSCYDSMDCQSQVRALSLSDQEDRLIASLDNKKIFFIILQKNKEWRIKQKLSVDQNGFRLSFIGQNQFVFQPFDRQYLQIFDYDAKDLTFKQGSKLEYANKADDNCGLSPIRFISSIGMIMEKNDRQIHFIKKCQNGQFTIEQSIDVGTKNFYCGITDDGRYLATCYNDSSTIQIQKIEY